MKRMIGLLAVSALTLLAQEAGATGWRKDSSALKKVNFEIKGRVIDFTANHGEDHRMWSRSLGQKRDLYVYLPPCYDKCQEYPVMFMLHAFASDEQGFLNVVPILDEAICKNKMPPMILVVPDGSLKGEPSILEPGSFFLNSDAGNYEDFLLQDVWDFVTKRYSIRSEREAHVLAGVSMGGFAAFNLGIRHRQHFGVVAGMHPALNLRWLGRDGDYFEDFDPRFWGWRNSLDNGRDVIARFGLARVRIGDFVSPLYGLGERAMINISRENPIELVDRTHLRDGDLAMFVGYGGKDEYNIDAQVESFLYLCKFRGITVHVGYDPDGRHDVATARRLLPTLIAFLNREVGPYAPGACSPCSTGACPPPPGGPYHRK